MRVLLLMEASGIIYFHMFVLYYFCLLVYYLSSLLDRSLFCNIEIGIDVFSIPK